MQTIDVTDALVTSLLVLDRPGAPDAPLRVVARLRDGRSFSLDVFTLAALQHRMRMAQFLVAAQFLLVREPTQEALVEAVRTAAAQGLERFGTLDEPLTQ